MKLSSQFHSFVAGVLLLGGIAVPAAQAAPPIQHWQTPAGARVYFVESRALPIIDVQVDFAAGSSYDPAGKAGLASLTRGVLDLGAGSLDESEVASRLADIGAQMGGGADLDRASVTLRTLSADDKREPPLEIMRNVLQAPRFAPDIIEREVARRVAGLKDALTRPDTLAVRAFWGALYPDHPYGRQATPESLASLNRSDVQAFHAEHYRAGRASVTLVGDLSRAQAEALAVRLLDGLPAGTGPVAPSAPLIGQGGESRIEHPSAQAHVYFGLPAIRRGDPDFFPLVVGNYSLGGGGFVSRLMQEVREKRGFAYSVYSRFSPLAQPGPFQVVLQTKKAQADEALGVARDVLARFVAEGPSAAELKAAKQNLVGGFPLNLDSNRKILDNVALIGFYGLPLDYLDRYAENVERVTAADVKAAFARHVDPLRLRTVVVGGETTAAAP